MKFTSKFYITLTHVTTKINYMTNLLIDINYDKKVTTLLNDVVVLLMKLEIASKSDDFQQLCYLKKNFDDSLNTLTTNIKTINNKNIITDYDLLLKTIKNNIVKPIDVCILFHS